MIMSLLVTFLLSLPGVQTESSSPPKPALTVMVAMRDGVRLATDVYLPQEGSGPWPALLVRTPYNKDPYAAEFGSWASKGYAMVVQDMRGRFASEGIDIAFLDCAQDGPDTIAWIAGQAWCDGTVGTVGASAMGITQNLAAIAAPEHLVAQYILVASGSLYHHGAFWDGALRLEVVAGYLFRNAFDEANLWLNVRHPMYDEHWKRLDAVAPIERADVPAVFYGGWYDSFLAGTIDTYLARQYRGGASSRGKHKLIIGPWCHGGPGTDARPKKTGEVLFPPNSRKLPCPLGAVEWFDHYLRGKDTGADSTPAVVYYTMGALDEPGAPGNVWRMEADWPPKAETTPWYLYADGSLAASAPGTAGERGFMADPANPVPTIGGGNLSIPAGMFDQRRAETREDVLVFTSEALDEPLEVTGPITADLHVSSDCPDTDVSVRLCDVYPDGRSMLVCDGILRLRHRRGVDRLDLLEPGKVVAIRVDLLATSMIFNRGHRLRVSVAGSNYPRFDVNPNTGWPAWAFCPTRMAHNTLHCSASTPSAIRLPIVRRDDQ